MNFFELFLLSLALAADAFTVGAAVGLRNHTPGQIFRLSFHFGLFQSLFSLAGILLGRVFVSSIENWSPWIAFGLLSLIGAKMIKNSFEKKRKKKNAEDPTRGIRLVGMSVAVSIDAMAAGIGLGAVRAPVALSVIVIGITSLAATVISMKLAGEVGRRFGGKLELIAGIVLIILGLTIVLKHIGIL